LGQPDLFYRARSSQSLHHRGLETVRNPGPVPPYLENCFRSFASTAPTRFWATTLLCLPSLPRTDSGLSTSGFRERSSAVSALPPVNGPTPTLAGLLSAISNRRLRQPYSAEPSRRWKKQGNGSTLTGKQGSDRRDDSSTSSRVSSDLAKPWDAHSFHQLSRWRRMAQSLASGGAGEFQTGPSTGERSICSPVVALNQNAR
jgi:hypothetical protein